MGLSLQGLVVSDLDGTLLRPDGTISAASIDILNGLVAKGLRFTVATARSPSRTLSAVRGLHLRWPLICLNGAVTVDPTSGRWLSTAAISADVVATLLALGERSRIAPLLLGEDGGHEVLMHLPPRGRVQDAFFAQRAGERRMRPVEALRPLARTLSVTFVDERERLVALKAGLTEAAIAGLTLRLMDYPEIPGGATLEISRDDVDKVARVAELAASMALGPDEVVVFGDHLNDLPMFAWAGTAVAVGNALPDVRSAADLHCESNDDDGVARFLAARLGATCE
jgi:Cof subfamily protein (haloacid dehalogenase superfamily)